MATKKKVETKVPEKKAPVKKVVPAVVKEALPKKEPPVKKAPPKKKVIKEETKPLETKIDYKPINPSDYDGGKFSFIYDDEAGNLPVVKPEIKEITKEVIIPEPIIEPVTKEEVPVVPEEVVPEVSEEAVMKGWKDQASKFPKA